MEKKTSRKQDLLAERQAQKLERKAREAKAKKKASLTNALIIAVVVVLVVLAVGLFAYKQVVVSGVIERHTTAYSSENYEVTESMFTYYFNNIYVGSQSTLSSYGLDTSKTLEEQSSFYDLVLSQAKAQSEQYLILCEAAKAAGVELDRDDLAGIEEEISHLKEQAREYGYPSTNDFIRRMCGTCVNIKDVEKCLKLNALATKYAQMVTDEKVCTDEEINTYFDEHSEEYETIDFLMYSFPALKDSDGNLDADSVAEMKAKAAELATKNDEESFTAYVEAYVTETKSAGLEEGEEPDQDAIDTAVNAIKKSMTLSEAKTSVSDVYEWLSSDDTPVNGTTVFENNETGEYLAYLKLTTPYREEYVTRNAALVLFENSENTDADGAAANASEFIARFEESETKNFETFTTIGKEFSDHVSSALSENIKKDDTSAAEVVTWLYTDGRSVGDYGTATTSDGVYAIFYDSDGKIAWMSDVETQLKSDAYAARYEEFEAAYAVTAVDDVISGVRSVSLSTSSN